MAWFRRDKKVNETTEVNNTEPSNPDRQQSTSTTLRIEQSITLEQDSRDQLSDLGSRSNSLTVTEKDVKLMDPRFEGVIAPVFTCFRDDEYAECLKSHLINGVLVNGVSGEGPSMRVRERKANCEYWLRAAIRYKLLVLVQVGGCPLPDVLSLAAHAEDMRVSAVITLPELFYRPRNVDQLVGYCKHVASCCKTRPFFYYHMPSMTGVDVDIVEFCAKAEQVIPNFMGVHYASTDLEMGQRCLRFGRVILLASTSLLATGLMSGFNSACLTVVNMRPELVQSIFKAINDNDMLLARNHQRELNQLMEIHTHSTYLQNWVNSMKNWFNKEYSMQKNGSFTAGPPRQVF
ncbi:N-acetylneuraminate lyase-like isoform X2 [Drosophila busckii]|uniref:N-acetylneuraminate lyase-like isoform X2 n=1 Tax=Drosophila busckii TaxID=30019 RepID=UPI00083E9718|nr:N-acetylneuraminate lyase-like isoform X2 [Drosophila busckii]